MPPVLKTLEIKKGADQLAASSKSAEEFLSAIVKLLHQNMLKYNWVGCYMLEPGADRPVLVLREYQGAMTPHTRIPLNEGICGAAVSSGQMIVVDDVSKDPRYLACSLETKSEIVAPVFKGGKVAGELDIDSHFPSAFSHQDREFVEYCAGVVGKKLESSPA